MTRITIPTKETAPDQSKPINTFKTDIDFPVIHTHYKERCGK